MNATTDSERLPEAYQRLHRFGPEYGGDEEGNHGLTNHGPMAVEVIVRRGLEIDVDRWLDRYVRRLAELPTAGADIRPDQWRSALGVARRLPDWTAYFRRELRERPWTTVLAEWWPRLLPGIVAGSTHGVIRVGHAVRTLRAGMPGCPTPTETLDELAHGLAFWAARYRELPSVAAPAGRLDAAEALPGVARLHDQSGFIAHRLEPARAQSWLGVEPARAAAACDGGGRARSSSSRSSTPRWRRTSGWGTAHRCCSCTPPRPRTRFGTCCPCCLPISGCPA